MQQNVFYFHMGKFSSKSLVFSTFSVGNNLPNHMHLLISVMEKKRKKSFSHYREATKMHKSSFSFCYMSPLMLVDSLGLDHGATRKMSVNAIESVFSC